MLKPMTLSLSLMVIVLLEAAPSEAPDPMLVRARVKVLLVSTVESLRMGIRIVRLVTPAAKVRVPLVEV